MLMALPMRYFNQINRALVIVMIISFHSLCSQDIRQEINIEKVRKELSESVDYLFPMDFIENLPNDKFKVFYLGDLCLIHIGYKTTDIQSSEKFSLAATYEFKNHSWVYKNSFPYYYNLALVDSTQRIFFSDNLFCYPDGACNRFQEICKFTDYDLQSLVTQSSYDSTLFFDRMLVLDRLEELKLNIGDTTSVEFEISEIRTNQNGLDNYRLTRRIKTLKVLTGESLQTELQESSEVISY